eukprot:scaffold74307_cov51-Attheya_sp.AAC.5
MIAKLPAYILRGTRTTNLHRAAIDTREVRTVGIITHCTVQCNQYLFLQQQIFRYYFIFDSACSRQKLRATTEIKNRRRPPREAAAPPPQSERRKITPRVA